jgi:hypothetical protein
LFIIHSSFLISQSLLTLHFHCCRFQFWGEEQGKNEAKKISFEFFYHFSQIPRSPAIKALILMPFSPQK